VELLNPNKWGAHDTLDFAVPSRDGKYVAYGRAQGGDENPITHVLEVATMKRASRRAPGVAAGGHRVASR